MREIKFRAWDRLRNKMFQVNSAAFYPEMDSGTLFNHDNDTIFIGNGTRDAVEIMQYVGLKDKNGREIYQDDLMRDLDNEICVVSWDKSGCWKFGLVWANNINSNEYEVIGNIYENPELLKGGDIT